MKEVPNRIMFSEMEEIHVSACSSSVRDISDSNPLSVHIISKMWMSSLPKQLHQVCQIFEFCTYIFSVFHLVINRQ